jgi:hypothetical protein
VCEPERDFLFAEETNADSTEGQGVGSAHWCNDEEYAQKQHYPAQMPGNGKVFCDFCLFGNQ